MKQSAQEYIILLEELVAIPSFSRDESAAADHLEQWMETHLLHPKRWKNNIWLESNCGEGEGKPVIMLNAHIDTVKPSGGYTREPFAAMREGDRIYGLGTNDDGASLVCMLAAFMHLSETQQPYRLMFSATAEEEVCGKDGIEGMVAQWGHIDLVIAGEPTQMQMAVAEKGLMVLDCTAHGKSGHAARNEGVNAIYKALESIDWFRNYQFPKVSEHLGPVKMTVSMINAGTQHNVVPDTCSFVVDVRPNGLYSNLEVLEIIKSSVSCDVKERSTRINSSSIAMDHAVVKRGLQLGLSAFGSPTTSNQAVIPYTSVKIGPGDSSRSHTADEFICISEIEEGIDTYIRLLDNLSI